MEKVLLSTAISILEKGMMYYFFLKLNTKSEVENLFQKQKLKNKKSAFTGRMS